MAVVGTSTVSQDVFTAVRALIVANKPSYTRTIAGTSTTFTYALVSEYPRDNPSFPVVVLNQSEINIVLINLDGSGEDYGVELQLDFYAKELHGKKAIDEGRDPLRATFIGNLSSFNTDNGLIPAEDFWNDSNTSTFINKNQVLHTASSIIKFRLK